VVSDGVTTIEPEVPFGVKLVPLQSVAFVLLHVSVDDSPAFIDLLARKIHGGLADVA
jgi:hypothetical protein